jgi:predicted  nucleic acid-binding Zn-ribbon protein
MRLNETTAGTTLNKELEKLFNDRKDAVRRLEQQAKKQDNELVVQQLNERTKEIDQKIREIADQLRKLKIPFPRKVLRFFKSSKRGKRN